MPESVLFWVAFGALWVIVGFQTLVLLGLVRLFASVEPRGHLEIGEIGLTGQTVPQFEMADLSGRVVSNDTVSSHVLLFVSPTCPTCITTLSELRAVATKSERMIILCNDSAAGCSSLVERLQLTAPVISDQAGELANLFQIPGYPTAVLIGPDSRVERYGQPMRADDLAEMRVAAR